MALPHRPSLALLPQRVSRPLGERSRAHPWVWHVCHQGSVPSPSTALCAALPWGAKPLPELPESPLCSPSPQPTAAFPWQQPTEGPFPARTEPSSIPSRLCCRSPPGDGTAWGTGARGGWWHWWHWGWGKQYAEARAACGAVGYEPLGSHPSHISNNPPACHCPRHLPLHPCLQEVSAV